MRYRNLDFNAFNFLMPSISMYNITFLTARVILALNYCSLNRHALVFTIRTAAYPSLFTSVSYV